jgi:hypothetical protein
MAGERIPLLPNLINSYTPTEPVSRIHEQKNIDEFIQTKAFDRIMTFVMLLNQSVIKKKISDQCFISPVNNIYHPFRNNSTDLVFVANSTHLGHA